MSNKPAININTITDALNSLYNELEKRIHGIQADLSGGRSQDSQEQAQETENDEVLHALAADARQRLTVSTPVCCCLLNRILNPAQQFLITEAVTQGHAKTHNHQILRGHNIQTLTPQAGCKKYV